MSVSTRNSPAILMQNVAERSARKLSGLLSKTIPVSLVQMSGRMAIIKIEANTPVPFPTITVPVLESEYIRAPLQKGCKGLLLCSDINIGHLSGMNTDRPNFNETISNLYSGIFIPFSHKNWDNLDGDFLQLYGLNGVQINHKLHGKVSVTLSDNNVIITNGSATISLNDGEIKLEGQVIINGQKYKAHTHSNGHEGAPTGGVL